MTLQRTAPAITKYSITNVTFLSHPISSVQKYTQSVKSIQHFAAMLQIDIKMSVNKPLHLKKMVLFFVASVIMCKVLREVHL